MSPHYWIHLSLNAGFTCRMNGAHLSSRLFWYALLSFNDPLPSEVSFEIIGCSILEISLLPLPEHPPTHTHTRLWHHSRRKFTLKEEGGSMQFFIPWPEQALALGDDIFLFIFFFLATKLHVCVGFGIMLWCIHALWMTEPRWWAGHHIYFSLCRRINPRFLKPSSLTLPSLHTVLWAACLDLGSLSHPPSNTSWSPAVPQLGYLSQPRSSCVCESLPVKHR